MRVVAFLRHLLRHLRRRPILVFWDGGQPHRSDLVKAFVHDHSRLEAHRFPGYSPELNPHEGIWDVINNDLANYCLTSLDELEASVRREWEGLEADPGAVMPAIRQTELTSYSVDDFIRWEGSIEHFQFKRE